MSLGQRFYLSVCFGLCVASLNGCVLPTGQFLAELESSAFFSKPKAGVTTPSLAGPTPGPTPSPVFAPVSDPLPTPTPYPSSFATPLATAIPSPVPTPTSQPLASPFPVFSALPVPTATPIPSSTPGSTPSPLSTAFPSPSPSPATAPIPTVSPTATPQPSPSASSSSASPASSDVLIQDILALTNTERSNAGLGTLVGHPLLNQAAQSHAQDMADNNFFSHTGLNGSTAGTRITATGYVWQTYGENIALGYGSATAVITGWMNSPGHRANILKAHFLEIGIGYALSPTGQPYYVQVFAKSL